MQVNSQNTTGVGSLETNRAATQWSSTMESRGLGKYAAMRTPYISALKIVSAGAMRTLRAMLGCTGLVPALGRRDSKDLWGTSDLNLQLSQPSYLWLPNLPPYACISPGNVKLGLTCG